MKDQQTLQDALGELPKVERPPSIEQVKKLGELLDGDLPLQSLLERLLPEVTSIFGGIAAVAWMKAQGAPGAVFGIRYNMEGVVDTVTQQKKHERLVQIAWKQRQPLLAEPTTHRGVQSAQQVSDQNEVTDSGQSTSQVSNSDAQQDASEQNPTKHSLLFGPILHAGESIALLEIVLDEFDTPLTQAEKHLYLRAVQLTSERIYGGLRKRMTLPDPTLQQAVDHLGHLTQEIQSLQTQIVRSIETSLQRFYGWTFASLSEKQAFAKLVHKILDSHGLRVQCPECGHPAILRCLRAGNAKHGAFVFDHYLETGRTFHGGLTTVPRLKVVAKPARRAALSNPA